MWAFIPASANCSGSDPAARPCLEERQPGSRGLRVIAFEVLERGEEEVGEHDIEPREEARVGKRRTGEMSLHALGDREVEPS